MFKSTKMVPLLIGALLFMTTLNAQEEIDSLSYSLGILMAQNLQSQGFEELKAESMSSAISDVLNGQTPKISAQEANMILQQYMMKKQEAQHGEAIAEGEAFLKANGEREGVVTLPSGLQYEVLTAGDGPKPTDTSKVKVHYHGTLINGTVFDSSVDRGEPATFGVGQVIAGWTEGLQLMPQGSKWKLFIPAELAYGARGAGGKIGPYATLIFEVELLEIL